MSEFISKIHSHLRNTRKSSAEVPEHALMSASHKVYERMEKVPLPDTSEGAVSLAAALARRTSATDGTSSTPITREELGTLFTNALKKRSDGHFPYPSGGSRHPIETYLISQDVDGRSGAFHYNPSAHVLEHLWESKYALEELVQHAPPFSAAIILTSVWARSSVKYGDFAYMLALLEAGHISQSLLLAGTAIDFRMRPMMSFDDEKISDLLDISDEEQPVLTITLSHAP